MVELKARRKKLPTENLSRNVFTLLFMEVSESSEDYSPLLWSQTNDPSQWMCVTWCWWSSIRLKRGAPWTGTFTHEVKDDIVDTPSDCSVMRQWMRVLQLQCFCSERVGTMQLHRTCWTSGTFALRDRDSDFVQKLERRWHWAKTAKRNLLKSRDQCKTLQRTLLS